MPGGWAIDKEGKVSNYENLPFSFLNVKIRETIVACYVTQETRDPKAFHGLLPLGGSEESGKCCLI